MAKYLCVQVRAYWFSVTSFSKWLPGGHIRFFIFWMAWFQQCNWSLLRNFSFKFHVHVLCGCRQKPNNCQLCRFQNGCLVILNNVTLWGGGILVDHWSTISSFLFATSCCHWHGFNIAFHLCYKNLVCIFCDCWLNCEINELFQEKHNSLANLLELMSFLH